MARKNLSKRPASAMERANAAEAASQGTTASVNTANTVLPSTGAQTGPRWDGNVSDADPRAGKFYNYYTGEWVNSEADIKPREGVIGNESGGYNNLLITQEDYANAGQTGGQKYVAPDGTVFDNPDDYDAYIQSMSENPPSSGGTPVGGGVSPDQAALDAKKAAGQSAYDLLYDQFNKLGLGALVTPLQDLIKEGLSPAEMTLRLRDTEAYKKRFAANAQRIAKGLTALDEAAYIGLEDQYQEVMRRYGLPQSYYARGDMGRQEGFENFIANDVSNLELEDRIQTAQNRVLYANPEVSIALKTFYPDITNGDILAYALDPEKALSQIKRRITAAEIGASAVQLGLATNVTDAEYLARYGVTKEQAQAGYRNVAEVLPRTSTLADIYSKQGMGAYDQATATQEMFNVPGAAEAAAKRRKLSELEQASFSGKAGVGALARERAGGF